MANGIRMNTAGVIASGILERGVPESSLPDGREWITYGQDYDQELSDEQALAILADESKAIHACNYYGIPHLWKEGEKYHLIVLQYRAVTEDETFTDAAEALERFKDEFNQTSG